MSKAENDRTIGSGAMRRSAKHERSVLIVAMFGGRDVVVRCVYMLMTWLVSPTLQKKKQTTDTRN